MKKSLVGGNVHGSYNAKEHNERWKKSPLFARLGQPLLFESGSEASELLATEARRRDPYQSDFLQAVDEVAQVWQLNRYDYYNVTKRICFSRLVDKRFRYVASAQLSSIYRS